MQVVGIDLYPLGPSQPFGFKFLGFPRVFLDQVVRLAPVLGQVVQFPSPVLVTVVPAHQLPVPHTDGAGVEMVETKHPILGGVGSLEKGRQALPLNRNEFLVIEFLRVLGSTHLKQGGHDVDQVHGGPHPAIGLGYSLGPMSQQGATIPPFVIEVLVHSQGRIAQAGPGATHRVIGSGATHLLEVIAFVKLGETFTTASVKTKGAPLVAGTVVAGEENEGVRQVPTLFQQGEDPTDPLVDMIDHGGEGRHPVGQILLSVLRNVLPVGVRFAGKLVGDVVTVDRDLGEPGEFP